VPSPERLVRGTEHEAPSIRR